MSSKRGGGQSNKGKAIASSSNVNVDKLYQAVHNVNLDSSRDDDWEVFFKKNKNKSGNSAASKQYQAPGANVRVQPESQRSSGRGKGQVRAQNNAQGLRTGGRGGASNYIATSNTITPPLQSGWNWNSRPANAGRRANVPVPQPEEDDNDIKELEESDDEFHSDEYEDEDEDDYDEEPKSHEERKKNKWYSNLFGTLDTLKLDQINEPMRQWHCSACQNGPGATEWYDGLQSLVTHAKTKGSKRVKIHRELAEILEEELRIRGASVIPAGEFFGQWKGLNDAVKDMEIVWPPTVIIRNTQLEQDDNDKWLGMGNLELLDYFGSDDAVRASHSYVPKGHKGIGVLIFESSAIGYTEAKCLSKHFKREGVGRDAWDNRPILFLPGGKRQLYGYMANKRDIEIFNQHSQGKDNKLKFELVSYQEKVVNQFKQMNEDNQQLHYLQNEVKKEQMRRKAAEESLDIVSQKLRKNEQQTLIVRERTQRYHEQNTEQMDYQELFIKNELKVIQDDRIGKESQFDKLQKSVNPNEREEKLEELKEFEEEREKLAKIHEDKVAELKKRYWMEEVALQEGYNADLYQLMDKYTPKS
ncbi:protein SUPPRESSOR OF GENE SILENCING 3-like [Rutidosis leptorrhynchoides]|uniref:protein SUPPRESSOR OF GENE SILENCING 3-like n=1 Tax=Rutidosis leptorrhynchoides TaxID=125765 RepID=UPI003A99B3CE